MTAVIGLTGADSGFARRPRGSVRFLADRWVRLTSSGFVLRGTAALRVVIPFAVAFVACRFVRFAMTMMHPFPLPESNGVGWQRFRDAAAHSSDIAASERREDRPGTRSVPGLR